MKHAQTRSIYIYGICVTSFNTCLQNDKRHWRLLAENEKKILG